MPDVVEHVRTEFPAAERLPATTPEYATVMGCRVTALAGLANRASGRPNAPSRAKVLDSGKRVANFI